MEKCVTYRLGRWIIEDMTNYKATYIGLLSSFWLINNCNEFDNLKDIKEGLLDASFGLKEENMVLSTSKHSNNGVDSVATTFRLEEKISLLAEEGIDMDEVEPTTIVIVYEA